MQPLGFHVTARLRDSRVIAPDTASQRTLADCVLRAARPWELLAFRWADTHGHLLVFGDEAGARELTRRALIAISRALRLPVPFAAPWHQPVLDQWHLDNSFQYVLRQDERHGFQHDPFADASNLPDLLGLRTRGLWTATHVRRRLPRVGRATLLGHLGVPDLDDRSVHLDDLPDGALADAAAAAGALVHPGGRSDAAVAARVAAIHAVPTLGAARLAALLRISPRSVRRLRQATPDPALVTAIQGQLRLRHGRSAVVPA